MTAIEGRQLPMWGEIQHLVRKAHRAFRDHVVVGWDVALLEDRACLVEGNSGPCVDLMQRPARQGIGGARLGSLVAFHLAKRLAAQSA